MKFLLLAVLVGAVFAHPEGPILPSCHPGETGRGFDSFSAEAPLTENIGNVGSRAVRALEEESLSFNEETMPVSNLPLTQPAFSSFGLKGRKSLPVIKSRFVSPMSKHIVQEQQRLVEAPVVQQEQVQVQEELPVQEKLVQEQIIQEELPVQEKLIQEQVHEEIPVQEQIQVQEELPVQEKLVQEQLPIQEKIEMPVKGLPVRSWPVKGKRIVQEPFPIKGQRVLPVEQFPIKGQEQVRLEAPVQQQQIIQEQLPVQQHELGQESLGLWDGPSSGLSAHAMRLGLSASADKHSPILESSFSCEHKKYGYYADVANKCRVYHICQPVQMENGLQMIRTSFFCPAATIFDQMKHICIHEADALSCGSAPQYFDDTVTRFAAPVAPVSSWPSSSLEAPLANPMSGYETQQAFDYSTKGGAMPLRSGLKSPMMTRTDFGVKGQPIVRSEIKGLKTSPTAIGTQFRTEFMPVKGKTLVEPIKGQLRHELPKGVWSPAVIAKKTLPLSPSRTFQKNAF